MNDWTLIFSKHSRVLVPFITAMLAVSIARLLSDSLVMQQVHGIATMLLMVGMTLYALDSVVRFIGLGDDRLGLMSPKSPWLMLLLNAVALGALLALAYTAHLLPTMFETGSTAMARLRGFGSYLVSVTAGLGLVTVLVYALKAVRGRGLFRALSWGAIAVVEAGLVAVTIATVISVFGERQWALGVSGAEDAVNVHLGFVPVSVLDPASHPSAVTGFAVANLVFALVLWGTAWLLSRRRNNYIEL